MPLRYKVVETSDVTDEEPDNVTRLQRLGVASWVVPKRFTGDRVAGALNELLTSKKVAESCRRWKEELAEADAVRETCELIEQMSDGRTA